MFFSKKPVSWIVVFLGNPGTKYAGTRHNVGFMTADVIERACGAKINKLKYKALTGTCILGGQQALLMKPQTFMNLSGDAVRQAMSFYKIPLANVIAVSDDVALPAGKLRVRAQGSHGGHNGLRDIIAKCGGEGFARVKIGVGTPPHADYDMADWVLSKPVGEDAKSITAAIERAAKAVETIIASGAERAMNEFN